MKKGSSQPHKVVPPPSIRWSVDPPAKHNRRDFKTTIVVVKVSFFYSRRNQCRTYFTCSGLCGFCPDDSEQELSPLRKESKDVRFDFIYCCIVLHRTVVHTPVLWLSPFPDLSFRRFWRLGHGISLPSSFDVSWLPAPSSPPYGIWADGTRPPVVTGSNFSWNSSIYYKNRWTMKRFSGSFIFE